MSQEFNLGGNFPIDELFSAFTNPALLRQFLGNRVAAATHPVQTTARSRRNFDMPIDVVNTDRFMYIYAEIPGVRKENIDIDFYNNKLTIILEKNRPYDDPDMSEIKYGRTERTITLPICVTRQETVGASVNNGVLQIKINKLIEEENKFNVRIQEGDESKGQDLV